MNETQDTSKTKEPEEDTKENENINTNTDPNDYTDLIIDNAHISGVNEKLNDVIITQSIICLVLAIGFVVFNLIKPEAAKLLFDRFTELCQSDTGSKIKDTFEQMKSLL